jgi:nucleolar complex protein 2
MGKKATKATKKFVSSGQLKKVIQARHKHRQILKRTQGRRGAKEGKDRAKPNDIEEEEEEEEPNVIQRFVRCVETSSMLMSSKARRL